MTHQRQFLPACDRVVVLRGGRVFADGTFAELAPLRLPELAGSEGAAASLDDAAYDAGVSAGGGAIRDPNPNPGQTLGQTLSTAWDRSGGASAETSAPASEAGGDADPDASRNPSKSPSTSSLAELSTASAATAAATGETQAPAAGGAGEPGGTAGAGAMPRGEAGPAAGPGPGSGSQGAAQQRPPRVPVRVPASVFDIPEEQGGPALNPGDPARERAGGAPQAGGSGRGLAGDTPLQGFDAGTRRAALQALDTARQSREPLSLGASEVPSSRTSAASALGGRDSGLSRAARRMRRELSSAFRGLGDRAAVAQLARRGGYRNNLEPKPYSIRPGGTEGATGGGRGDPGVDPENPSSDEEGANPAEGGPPGGGGGGDGGKLVADEGRVAGSVTCEVRPSHKAALVILVTRPWQTRCRPQHVALV